MTHYRIYGLAEDGTFAWAIDAECSNDHEACVTARMAPKLERVREVWRGTTRVGVILGDGSVPKDDIKPASSGSGWLN